MIDSKDITERIAPKIERGKVDASLPCIQPPLAAVLFIYQIMHDTVLICQRHQTAL